MQISVVHIRDTPSGFYDVQTDHSIASILVHRCYPPPRQMPINKIARLFPEDKKGIAAPCWTRHKTEPTPREGCRMTWRQERRLHSLSTLLILEIQSSKLAQMFPPLPKLDYAAKATLEDSKAIIKSDTEPKRRRSSIAATPPVPHSGPLGRLYKLYRPNSNARNFSAHRHARSNRSFGTASGRDANTNPATNSDAGAIHFAYV